MQKPGNARLCFFTCSRDACDAREKYFNVSINFKRGVCARRKQHWLQKRKKPRKARLFSSWPNYRLALLNVRSLLALRALRDVKLDFLTFFQGLEAVHLDCGEVSEQIFAAVIRSDKAKAFGIIEPLDSTCCHKSIFQILTITRAVKARSIARHAAPLKPCPLRIDQLLHLVTTNQ